MDSHKLNCLIQTCIFNTKLFDWYRYFHCSLLRLFLESRHSLQYIRYCEWLFPLGQLFIYLHSLFISILLFRYWSAIYLFCQITILTLKNNTSNTGLWTMYPNLCQPNKILKKNYSSKSQVQFKIQPWILEKNKDFVCMIYMLSMKSF